MGCFPPQNRVQRVGGGHRLGVKPIVNPIIGTVGAVACFSRSLLTCALRTCATDNVIKFQGTCSRVRQLDCYLAWLFSSELQLII